MSRKPTIQSSSVVPATDSPNFPVSVASLPLPTGAATAAKQDTLAALLPASIGQKDKAGSLSIVLPTDQVGTAGTPATDVLTMQGITGGTPVIVGGAVAAGSADSGNPVKIGGKYNATKPTLADGQRGDLQHTTRGAIIATLFANDSASAVSAGNDADAQVNSGIAMWMQGHQYVYNGATWDRARAANVWKPIADASVTAATGVTAWTPTAGKKFRLLRGSLSLSVAGQITLCDNALGSYILRSPKLEAGKTWDFDLGALGFLSAATNNVLKIDVSSTGNVGGWIGGTEE